MSDLRAQLNAARARFRQQEQFRSNVGPVYVKASPAPERIVAHCEAFSGSYRLERASGSFVLTEVHTGTPPAALIFGFQDRGIIRDLFLDEKKPEDTKKPVDLSTLAGYN